MKTWNNSKSCYQKAPHFMRLMFADFSEARIFLFSIVPSSITVLLCSRCQSNILKQKWNCKYVEWISILSFPAKRSEIRLSLKLPSGQRSDIQRQRPPETWDPMVHLTDSKEVHHDLLCPHYSCMPWSTVYFGDKIIAKSEYFSWPNLEIGIAQFSAVIRNKLSACV